MMSSCTAGFCQLGNPTEEHIEDSKHAWSTRAAACADRAKSRELAVQKAAALDLQDSKQESRVMRPPRARLHTQATLSYLLYCCCTDEHLESTRLQR
jgi:hypothetical protein